MKLLSRFLLAFLWFANLGTISFAQLCLSPANGSGSTNLPADCALTSPTGTMDIISGLPAGSTLQSKARLASFFSITRTPGGSLGGETDDFQGTLTLEMDGTGSYAGYHRSITLTPTVCRMDHASRTSGLPVQMFLSEMMRLQTQITGDPDFDLLRITAGTDFGMPSPGHTTLARTGSDWNVDSFFDIEYRIDFVGHSGGPFGGMSGSTTGTIRMTQGQPIVYPQPCLSPDNGSTTTDLPANCPFGAPIGTMDIINGLPVGSMLQSKPLLDNFVGVVRTAGGSLGGETDAFGAELMLEMDGTGDFAGYHRSLRLAPVNCQMDHAPRTPGSARQSFNSELVQFQTQITGDPDFDLLRITAGTGFGMPSPGHTTLSRTGSDWNVDSFFDIEYRIDFIGHPGGRLGGMSGSTTGTIRMTQGQPIVYPQPCLSPDNGSITTDLPANCPFGAPIGTMDIINGLPVGSMLQSKPLLDNFVGVVRTAGGSLGGEADAFEAELMLEMDGTGDFAGYHRSLRLAPVSCQMDHAPRTPGALRQSFDSDLMRFQTQITGDPDFDLLRITAGTAFGMPSPGHTTLTRTGSDWSVDSFFDIEYRIDFIGHPGGRLGGRSGSTTGTIRMMQGQPQTQGTIQGEKWNDVNGNGVKEPGEPGLAGWKIILCDTSGRVLDSTRTDPAGNYSFPGVPAGNYRVKEEGQPGWFQTSVPVVYNVTVVPGAVNSGIDFGNFEGEIDVISLPTAIDVVYPDAHTETVHLNGPMTVHVKITPTGGASDTDFDGLEQVQTEMVQLSLTGVSPTLGPLTVHLNSSKTTKGEIEENVNNTPGTLDVPPFAPSGTASSFFDVFFEIQGPTTMHNDVAEHVAGTIHHKPPGPCDPYVGNVDVMMLDANGNPTGIRLTRVTFGITGGTICVAKFDDINHNQLRDPDEPPMPNVGFVLTDLATNQTQNQVTDATGVLCFSNLPPGDYRLTEIMPPGYTVSRPKTGEEFITMRDCETTKVEWLNAAALTDSTFRTATYEEWATTVDIKNARKPIKCKPDKVEFKVNLVVPPPSTGNNFASLVLKFSMPVDSLRLWAGKQKTVPYCYKSATPDPKRTTWTLDLMCEGLNHPPYPPTPGDTIQIEGHGLKGKPITVAYLWTNAAGLLPGKLPTKPLIHGDTLKQWLRLPMPNLVNVLGELADQGVFPIVVGGAVGDTHSVYLKNVGDLLKSLAKPVRNGPFILHDSTTLGECFDSLGGKLVKKQIKGISPDKIKHRLFAEALTLKLNILASRHGKFPPGFDTLIYDYHKFRPGPFDGKHISEIMKQIEMFLSCKGNPKPLADAMDYFFVLRRLNGAFSGPMDTVRWNDCVKLVLKGVRKLKDVPFLRAEPGALAQFVDAPFEQSSVNRTPATYELLQNYPNPFNPTTTIQFELAEPAEVTLKVFNALGQEIATLLDRELMEDGTQDVEFNANTLPSGVYFYRIIAQGLGDEEEGIAGQRYVSVKKMLLIK